MSEWQDAPEWLIKLVRGKWGAPEWRAWENLYKPELESHDVTPELLEAVGDPERPIAIGARPPGGRWYSGAIHWEADGDVAVLEGLRRLVEDLRAG